MARSRVLATFLVVLFSAPAPALFEAVPSLPLQLRPDFSAVRDLNGDGVDDLLLVTSQNGGGELLFVVTDTTKGPSLRIAQRVPFPVDSPSRPALGDLNGDGLVDAVVPFAENDGLLVFAGIGDGTFSEPQYFPAGLDSSAAIIADFDGTRGNDIAVADRRAGDVLVLLNDGNSPPCFQLALRAAVGGSPEWLEAVDFNGDGRLDLATLGRPTLLNPGQAMSSPGEVALLLAEQTIRGLPVFQAARRFDAGREPSDLQVGDIDGDGLADIAFLDQPEFTGATRLRILRNAGSGFAFEPRSATLSCPFPSAAFFCQARALTAADFDGDGRLDFAVAMTDPRGLPSAEPGGAILTLWTSERDGNIAPVFVETIANNPLRLRKGDFSADGRPDVVVMTADNAAQLLVADGRAGALIGSACGSGSDCASGRCTNGVCCATVCRDSESCNVPGREGFCLQLSEKRPCFGDTECAGTDRPTCTDGYCCEACPEGRCDLRGFAGRCTPLFAPGELCGNDESCDSGECRRGLCCREDFCPPWGECGFETGACEGFLVLGELCSEDYECESRICDRFDGVCCAEVCDQSETCSAAVSSGSCAPLFPAPSLESRCPALVTCAGDCNNDRDISISELMEGAQISLALRAASTCRAFDGDASESVEVNELILAVRAALFGC